MDIQQIPCPDDEYYQGIEFLRSQCPAFQRYQQEIRQTVIDNLLASNCLIAALMRTENSLAGTLPLQKLNEINKLVIEKIRQ